MSFAKNHRKQKTRTVQFSPNKQNRNNNNNSNTQIACFIDSNKKKNFLLGFCLQKSLYLTISIYKICISYMGLYLY